MSEGDEKRFVPMRVRLKVQSKPKDRVRVSVFVPTFTGEWHLAGALQMSELVWRVLIFPTLHAGAVRRSVTIELTT